MTTTTYTAATLDTQVTDIADDWQAPEFYQELDLEKARLVVKFGDLAHLFVRDFEKHARAHLIGDLSAASFSLDRNASAVELEVKAKTMQWVIEMMGLSGLAEDYALNNHPEDAAFIVVYRTVDSGEHRLFRSGGGSPGAALTAFAERYPQHYKMVSALYVDKRSLSQPVMPAAIG
ncbi:hypothetical protein [Pseudomonas sp. 460]|uniref:hypothetical protein n=1 Tax=Pseudomonas sp. 460 TaxID=2485142 RepID=UPI00104E44AB|nr:hypothetical protein [Pseudomonas sp. 460]TCV51595.1 hypothetical protein EDB99_107261 [Pseudomonas sp. 460]